MQFDVNRLAKLAGIGNSGSSLLSEASNRSMHDDAAVSDEADYRFGKGQLAETGEKDSGSSEDDDSKTEKGKKDYTTKKGAKLKEDWGTEPGEEAYNELYDLELEEDDGGDDGDGYATKKPKGGKRAGSINLEANTILDIDENMLREEITKMRRRRLEENALRQAIRTELKGILDDVDLNITSDWMYGNNKPTRSGRGKVFLAFPGPGFR